MGETIDSQVRKGRTNDRRRWLALLLVCAAQPMIVLDGTIVNVALPAIQIPLPISPQNNGWWEVFGPFDLSGLTSRGGEE